MIVADFDLKRRNSLVLIKMARDNSGKIGRMEPGNMDYKEFTRIKEEISRLMAGNQFQEAEGLLLPLLRSDIADIDKAAVCVNLARIEDRKRNSEEALQWLDKGIAYEEIYFRYEVSEEKVRYLTQIGRYQEAVPILEELLKQPCLSESEKDRIQKAMKSLLSRSLGNWM
jgi:tetratricopeptide (TPR) repeat protein